jgi:4-amino-4-deoxy-L-arabinose transferase-like glycosyltransferase
MAAVRISLRAAVAADVLLRLLLIACAAWNGGPAAFLVGDSVGYRILARHLAFDGAFLDRWGSGTPELFRTPGYPLLLVPGMWMGQSVAFAIALNVLASVAIVIVTYRLARRLLDERLAGFCALVVALEPTMLTWSLKVMPETLFTLCLVLFTAAALQGLETRQTRWIVAAATAIVGAAYLRPIAYPLVFVIALAAFFAIGARRAFIFLVTAAALLAPWHLRNAWQTGYPGFSTVTERSLYFSAGGAVRAERENRPFADVRRDLLEQGRLRDSAADATHHGAMARGGLAMIAANPLAWGTAHVRGMLRTLFDPGAAAYLRLFGAYSAGARSAGGAGAMAHVYPLVFWSSVALAIVLLPLVVLPIVAAFRVPREQRTPFVLLALVAAYLVFASGGPPGNYRFRAPVVPFLVLMGAHSLLRSEATKNQPRRRTAGDE